MQPLPVIEHLALIIRVLILSYLLWLRYQDWQARSKKKKKPKQRKWRPKSPSDCPACQKGLRLAVRPIQRQVKPWCEHKSKRDRKKRIKTQGYACPDPDCRYFGVTDEQVHALCWRQCYAMFREAWQTGSYSSL
jgi:hypothetical protein